MVRILLLSLLVLKASLSFAAINRFSRVDAGIYRGAQPQVVSDYQFLKASGVNTIINLRETPTDVAAEAMVAHELGFIFRSYPIDGNSNPNQLEVSQILIDLNTRALLPIFIHCQEGKDRTGMIIGIYRVKTEHWDPNRD